MRPSRLRALLIATLLAVQLGTVAIFVDDARRRVEETLDAQARAALVELAETAAARTRGFLRSTEAPLRSAAELLAGDALDPRDDLALERRFRAQLNANEWLRAIYFGRPDGSFVSIERKGEALLGTRLRRHAGGTTMTLERRGAGVGRRHRVVHDDGYDPRQRPWYRLARAAPGVVGWVDPYVFFSARIPGVSAAVGVRSGSETGEEALLGVLGIDVDIGALSDFIAAVTRGGRGSAVLLDASGAVIGASRPDWLGFGAEGYLPRLDQIAEGPLGALSAFAVTEEGDVGPVEFEFAGRRHLGLVRPLADVGGWSLLVQVPVDGYSGALGEYFAIRTRTLLALLALLSLGAMAAIVGATAPLGRIHRDATRDHLTGALSRAEFERRLDGRLRARRRRERDERLVLAALDLDGFKAVNDTHGHGAGDEVLVELVRRLRRRLRHEDLIGRAGGDEFLLALTLSADDDPHAVVEGIRRAVAAEPVHGELGRYRVGATVGAALHAPPETRTTLVERADRALVAGKAFAKNRTYLAREAPSGTPAEPLPIS